MNKNDIPVMGHQGLVRSADSGGGIIKNTDKETFIRFISNREKKKQEMQQIENMQSELDALKALVADLIKSKESE